MPGPFTHTTAPVRLRTPWIDANKAFSGPFKPCGSTTHNSRAQAGPICRRRAMIPHRNGLGERIPGSFMLWVNHRPTRATSVEFLAGAPWRRVWTAEETDHPP